MSIYENQDEMMVLKIENYDLKEELENCKRKLNYFGWYCIDVSFCGTFKSIIKIQNDLIKITKENFVFVEKKEYWKGEDESLVYISSSIDEEVSEKEQNKEQYYCFNFYSKIAYATLFLKEILKYSKENSCSFACTIFDFVDYCDELYYSNITNGELVYSNCTSFKYSSWNIDKEWENTVDSIIENVKEKDVLCYDTIPIVKSGVSGYSRGRSTVSYIMAYSFVPFLAASMLLKNPKASFAISNALMATDIVVNNGMITYPKIQNIETA